MSFTKWVFYIEWSICSFNLYDIYVLEKYLLQSKENGHPQWFLFSVCFLRSKVMFSRSECMVLYTLLNMASLSLKVYHIFHFFAGQYLLKGIRLLLLLNSSNNIKIQEGYRFIHESLTTLVPDHLLQLLSLII